MQAQARLRTEIVRLRDAYHFFDTRLQVPNVQPIENERA